MDEPDRSSAQARPRFFAASLSDYNNGILHGEWIDASADVSAMRAEVDEMLTRSPSHALFGEPAEEWVIADSDGFVGVLDAHTTVEEIAAEMERQR